MLLARRNNNSDWLSNIFDDVFFDTDATPRMNATAPATNIKETDKDYIMEVAAPGLKKEWVRVNIDNDGNLNIAIENKFGDLLSVRVIRIYCCCQVRPA